MRPLPFRVWNCRRTIASAQTTPNTVLIGTAIAVISSVSLNAWTVFGSESDAHKGWSPRSKAR